MTTNGQTMQGTTTAVAQGATNTEHDDDTLDDGRYEARCAGVKMGKAGGKGGHQLFIDVDLRHNGRWVRRTKYNNLTTPAGIQIATADGAAFGFLSDEFAEWFPDPEKLADVILKSEEYDGKWRQVVKNIWPPRRQEYTPEEFKSVSASFAPAVRAARIANAEHAQKKAEERMAGLATGGGGRRGGRSNELPPQQQSGGTERDDFGSGTDDFGGGGGSGEPERF